MKKYKSIQHTGKGEYSPDLENSNYVIRCYANHFTVV